MDPLLTTAGAARALGVVRSTVRAMVWSGRLPLAATTEHGHYLFRRADVERLASERAKQPRRRGALAAMPVPEAVSS